MSYIVIEAMRWLNNKHQRINYMSYIVIKAMSYIVLIDVRLSIVQDYLTSAKIH